jgi:hypothetical protein
MGVVAQRIQSPAAKVMSEIVELFSLRHAIRANNVRRRLFTFAHHAMKPRNLRNVSRTLISPSGNECQLLPARRFMMTVRFLLPVAAVALMLGTGSEGYAQSSLT